MKLYIGNKKDKENKKIIYGMTLYSDTGDILYSAKKIIVDVEVLRFNSFLKSVLWSIKKIKSLVDLQKVDKSKIDIIMDNKTAYTWFCKEDTPVEYKDIFSDIMLEMSFLSNDLELILGNVNKKVLFRDINQDNELIKATDMFTQMEG